MINNNDIIELDLIIKDKNTNSVLDTTHEDIAKEGNIYDSKTQYKPLVVVFGKGELLKAVEENIKDLEIGKTKEFSLSKEKAFGERDPKLIQLLPLADFKKENIDPKPGMFINLGNRQAKVLNVSGGRVQLDLNNEFAGRDLDYKITLKKVCVNDSEKSKALFDKYFFFMPKDKTKVQVKDKTLELIIPGALPKEIEYLKYVFIQSIFDTCNFENVHFIENYEKKKQ